MFNSFWNSLTTMSFYVLFYVPVFIHLTCGSLTHIFFHASFVEPCFRFWSFFTSKLMYRGVPSRISEFFSFWKANRIYSKIWRVNIWEFLAWFWCGSSRNSSILRRNTLYIQWMCLPVNFSMSVWPWPLHCPVLSSKDVFLYYENDCRWQDNFENWCCSKHRV